MIGYGSIGSRHAHILSELGCNVVIVSRRDDVDWPARYPNIQAALNVQSFELAIVANETSIHWSTIGELRAAGFSGPILVEKPLASELPATAAIEVLRPNVWIGYNLRFHPALQKLKLALVNQTVVSAACRVGQDLRTWREGRELAQTYSVRRSLGGGVLRDLSHELDYISWLFGGISSVVAVGGRMGSLTIDSDDSWQILAKTHRAPSVSIQLNYYTSPAERNLCVNTEAGTIEVDLLRHTYRDWKVEQSWNVDRDSTYRDELNAFKGERCGSALCTFDEGLAVVLLIDAIERSAMQERWVWP